VDDPPLAVNDSAVVVAGSPATSVPVLTNDNANNPDQGELLTIVGATRPGHGSVAILAGGIGLKYRPAAGFHGTDRFSYTIRDPAGHADSAIVLVSVPVDKFKPVATAPAQSIVGPQTIGATTVAIRVTWTATDKGAGVARYQLYRSKNGGPWQRVSLRTALTRSVTQALTVNASYRFRARAVDKVGNVGAFAYGPTFKVRRIQETPSTALTYVGTWGTSTSASYSGGHAKASVTALDSATYSFTGRNIAWVAARSKVRGSARILIDGVVVGTVNLQSTTTSYRRVVYVRSFGALGPHTIQIVVLGTAGHPRVDIDTFVVVR
jgi:hypothetical protein